MDEKNRTAHPWPWKIHPEYARPGWRFLGFLPRSALARGGNSGAAKEDHFRNTTLDSSLPKMAGVVHSYSAKNKSISILFVHQSQKCSMA